MKILLLADPASSHVMKWANSLNRAGIKVFLFGLFEYNPEGYDKGITIIIFQIPGYIKRKKDGNLLKAVYLLSLPKLWRTIRQIKPDVLHAHSASSFGLIGALSKFHPFLLSIWGNDVYIFPKKSPIHKRILEFAFNKADEICATGKSLKEEAAIYTSKGINIVAFGVDTNVFKPLPTLKDKGKLIIGTVKTLETIYGIRYLIEAFSILKKENSLPRLKLEITGSGSLEQELKNYTKKLGIEEDVTFHGIIEPWKIVDYHNRLDIAVYPSISEGFGVSVIESSACEKPVIASNIGGLPEVVVDGVTGYLIPPADSYALAAKLRKLILNKELIILLGKNGRIRVKDKFEWNDCVDQMICIYSKYCGTYA